MIDLGGKVALVTGASKGIGLATARLFAECGARVMLSSRQQQHLDAAGEQMTGDFALYAANAGDAVQADACVAATIDRFGVLDILVNNAATSPYFGPLIDADLERFDKTIDVNLRGPLVWTQIAWRRSMREHGGNVINIGSIGASSYNGPLGVYQTSKAGLEYITRHLANELGPGTRVNLVAAGLIKTDFSRALWESSAPEGGYPWALSRIGTPMDVAKAALFLASDLSAWMTGQVLVVDGGALIARATL